MTLNLIAVAVALFVSQANAAEGVFPLTTIAPDGPISELAPLAPLAENARIVGIGEISHGTTNDTSRFKVAKYLVENHGYRVIFGEHSIGTTLQTDYRNFIARGQGDFDAFVRLQSSSVFRTQEYAAFFRWMAEYNRTHSEDPVVFLGVDVLNDPFLMVRELERAETAVDDSAEFTRELNRVKESCLGARSVNRATYYADPEFLTWETESRLDPARVAACVAAAEKLQIIVDRSAPLLVGALGTFGAAVVRNMPRSIRVFEIDKASYRVATSETQSQRGQVMFDNLTTYWEALGQDRKAIYFAHNYHTSKKQRELTYSDWPSVYNTGERLAARFGDAYRSIGFTGFTVSAFYYPDILQSEPNSIETALNQRAEDLFLVDTRGEFARSQTWSGFNHDQTLRFEDHFDFLFYQRNVMPSTRYFP